KRVEIFLSAAIRRTKKYYPYLVGRVAIITEIKHLTLVTWTLYFEIIKETKKQKGEDVSSWTESLYWKMQNWI
ncbi:hypothetical protein, partial [Bacillus altitudinis]|uniref:hypothetical protein n=1 Tax=Bacillus altitudinis TaxID=293387 RepID=UPI00197A90D0